MRTPAVLCEVDCDDRGIDTTVEALDVGPRAAAYLWRQDGGDTYGISSVWNLAVAPLRGGRPRVLSAGFVDGACGYVFPFAPTAVGDGVFWVAAGSTCERTQTAFGLASARSRRLREAKVSKGLIFGATRDGDTVYWLRAPFTRRNDQLGFGDLCARSACTIVRSQALHWRTLKRGRSPGPYPESD